MFFLNFLFLVFVLFFCLFASCLNHLTNRKTSLEFLFIQKAIRWVFFSLVFVFLALLPRSLTLGIEGRLGGDEAQELRDVGLDAYGAQGVDETKGTVILVGLLEPVFGQALGHLDRNEWQAGNDVAAPIGGDKTV